MMLWVERGWGQKSNILITFQIELCEEMDAQCITVSMLVVYNSSTL